MNAVRKMRPGIVARSRSTTRALPVAAVAAAHAPEHRVGRVLERHVDVRDDARVVARGARSSASSMRLRVEVEEAHPAHARHVGDAAHELGERAVRSSVARSRPYAMVSCETRLTSSTPLGDELLDLAHDVVGACASAACRGAAG